MGNAACTASCLVYIIRISYYHCCGFQVIDRAVAWILSRVGPTIRRGHRFVSCGTTAVVCIPRLLYVVVSLIRCLVNNHWLTPSQGPRNTRRESPLATLFPPSRHRGIVVLVGSSAPILYQNLACPRPTKRIDSRVEPEVLPPSCCL